MILLPLLALLIGLVFAALLPLDPVKGAPGVWFAIACLAGIDSIIGGVRAGLEGKFANDVFLTGFLSNTIIAFFLSWLGDGIGINLTLVIGLVLGGRVFVNLSLIRRHLLTKWQDARARKRLQQQTSKT